MRSYIVLCHYNGILRSEEEDPVYIGGEKRVLLVDGDVPFDLFESQIRRASSSGFSPIKIIYFLKCEANLDCAQVLLQEDLTVMSYLYNLYKVGRTCIYVDKGPYQTLSPSRVEAKERYLPNLNDIYASQCGDDTDLHVKDNSFKGEDEVTCPP